MTYAVAFKRRWYHRIKEWPDHVRGWLLEDRADVGLGGPPNKWQASPKYPSRQYGSSSGVRWWQLAFGNDAGDVHLVCQFIDEDDGRIRLMLSARDFRPMALWYLWRWAYGEWFGLRRRLYFWWLHRHLERHRRRYAQSVYKPQTGEES